MRVTCPECRTVYQLPEVEDDALLVCHRCNAEFRATAAPGETAGENMPHADPAPEPEASETTPPAEPAADAQDREPPVEDAPVIIPAREVAASEPRERQDPAPNTPQNAEHDAPISPQAPEPASEAAETDSDDADEEFISPPARKKARILPWLIAVLLIIGGTGFWLNHDAWLDDPWLRSVLINIGMPLEVRDKDWHIDPDSVEATWLQRSGGDTVLVITGDVHNRLQSELLPPRIHVTLFARDNPDERILERDLIITRPPLMQAIRRTPYTPPPRDATPVPALGSRGFVLVLENMPQNAGNFTLSPLAR